MDENLSEYVADALNLLNKGYFQDIEVISTKKVPGLGLEAPDEKIISYIGKEMGVLVTRDYAISRTKAIYQLCDEYNIIVIFIRLPKGSDRHWDLVKLLIKHWEELIKIIKSNTSKSFILSPRKGVDPLS